MTASDGTKEALGKLLGIMGGGVLIVIIACITWSVPSRDSPRIKTAVEAKSIDR